MREAVYGACRNFRLENRSLEAQDIASGSINVTFKISREKNVIILWRHGVKPLT